MPVDDKDVYQQTCDSIRATDETSFKLLGLVPALAGGSVLALFLGKNDSFNLALATPLALFGALITLGVFRWELRNIQTCNWLRDRASELEATVEALKNIGLAVMPRPPHLIGKTEAAKFVYAVTILGWLSVPWIVKAPNVTLWWYPVVVAGIIGLTLYTAIADVRVPRVKNAGPLKEVTDQIIARNADITAAENAGDLEKLGNYVASALAFQRRDGTVVDRQGFLAAKPGSREMSIESVRVFGHRAVVTCVIRDGNMITHNIRLFTRIDDDWKLLGWANEPC